MKHFPLSTHTPHANAIEKPTPVAGYPLQSGLKINFSHPE